MSAPRPLRFTLGADERGRLDVVLAARFPGVGRRRWTELFAQGWVTVDGRVARNGERVGPGAEVSLKDAPTAAARRR